MFSEPDLYLRAVLETTEGINLIVLWARANGYDSRAGYCERVMFDDKKEGTLSRSLFESQQRQQRHSFYCEITAATITEFACS